VIFQCPTKFGKGILVAPTVHGNLIVGPSNDPSDDADDVRTTSNGLLNVAKQAGKSVPSLNLRESIRNFAGLRAQSDKDDFIIAEADDAPGFIDLAGIKSPGLTAAPAIAKMAVELLQGCGLAAAEKPEFIDRRKHIRFKELPVDKKIELVREKPAYGRVICRCETITEGEILDAIDSPVPPCSVDGIKRRCNAGMGRCQGGFCGPRVVELLSRELDISPLDVLQDKNGTNILTGETKGGSRNV
jgi:glycerol-3-phosphate dehydrogenase